MLICRLLTPYPSPKWLQQRDTLFHVTSYTYTEFLYAHVCVCFFFAFPSPILLRRKQAQALFPFSLSFRNVLARPALCMCAHELCAQVRSVNFASGKPIGSLRRGFAPACCAARICEFFLSFSFSLSLSVVLCFYFHFAIKRKV